MAKEKCHRAGPAPAEEHAGRGRARGPSCSGTSPNGVARGRSCSGASPSGGARGLRSFVRTTAVAAARQGSGCSAHAREQRRRLGKLEQL